MIQKTILVDVIPPDITKEESQEPGNAKAGRQYTQRLPGHAQLPARTGRPNRQAPSAV